MGEGEGRKERKERKGEHERPEGRASWLVVDWLAVAASGWNQSKPVGMLQLAVSANILKHAPADRTQTRIKPMGWMDGWMNMPMDRWKWIGGLMDGWMENKLLFGRHLPRWSTAS